MTWGVPSWKSPVKGLALLDSTCHKDGSTYEDSLAAESCMAALQQGDREGWRRARWSWAWASMASQAPGGARRSPLTPLSPRFAETSPSSCCA